MKKSKPFLCLLMSAIMIFSICPCAFASNVSISGSCGDPVKTCDFSTPIKEFAQMAISVFCRLFNTLLAKDENNIEKAPGIKKSWKEIDTNFIIENPETEMRTQTWIANELTFESEKTYADSFNDITLDLILIGNGRKYTVPGFWDGGNTWKIRFVCPSVGDWYFYTICSDGDNSILNNRTGKIICTAYDGEYDIYKNGFVTSAECEKYLTYDNGEPFFYLGDTHWGLGGETQEMVKTICEKRYAQGFTVIQSEPIGAEFCVEDGVTQSDIDGFKAYDLKFETIAQYGFVHANAEFFYPSQMDVLISTFGGYSDKTVASEIDAKQSELKELSDEAKQYIEKLCRYWVARYSAYPVIWTLGQEVDNDFYYENGEHTNWGIANNPYKLIAEYIEKYDCYDHPLTAHQENTGAVSAYGNGDGASENRKIYNKNAKPSAFRDVDAHTFYAAQWTPSKSGQFDFSVTKDYWYNSQRKPSINYEGAYCGLWTKDFGARMQGWCSYLSGMYGYGWGAQDTWCYLNPFGEDEDSFDGVDTITQQEKIDANWQTALNYESGYQCGYMADFLQSTEWYNLIPRFDNKAYFTPAINVYYACASTADNSKIVVYFYSFNDESVAQQTNSNDIGAISTGTVGNLEKRQTYKYKWFNPITGEYTQEGTFVSSFAGTWYVGQKPGTDMVLYIEKA